jgi:hypothetical protein
MLPATYSLFIPLLGQGLNLVLLKNSTSFSEPGELLHGVFMRFPLPYSYFALFLGTGTNFHGFRMFYVFFCHKSYFLVFLVVYGYLLWLLGAGANSYSFLPFYKFFMIGAISQYLLLSMIIFYSFWTSGLILAVLAYSIGFFIAGFISRDLSSSRVIFQGFWVQGLILTVLGYSISLLLLELFFGIFGHLQLFLTIFYQRSYCLRFPNTFRHFW